MRVFFGKEDELLRDMEGESRDNIAWDVWDPWNHIYDQPFRVLMDSLRGANFDPDAASPAPGVVGPTVKGWYVEFVIDTHYQTIDRRLRMIMTWDQRLERYRVWRFATLPQQPPGALEGEARFVGDTLVMEWTNMRTPDGRRGALRNRVFMDGPDELVIISEGLPEGANEWVRLSEFRNSRRF